MRELLLPVYSFLAQLGGAGLFFLGILDSSFLFVPLGNDLLMLGLTASRPARIALFAALASAGSVTGCLITDLIARKGGEQGLSRIMPEKRIEYVKSKVRKKAAWALILAALLPPPFPFTPFVAAAAALQYPRRRMMTILLCARFLRFTIVGVLAVSFGKTILKHADSRAVQIPVITILVLAVLGSIVSVFGWIQRSKRSTTAA